jgi:hypothetical protein
MQGKIMTKVANIYSIFKMWHSSDIWERTNEGEEDAYRTLVGPRRRWVDNIKMDLRKIGWDGMDWIDLAQDRGQ